MSTADAAAMTISLRVMRIKWRPPRPGSPRRLHLDRHGFGICDFDLVALLQALDELLALGRLDRNRAQQTVRVLERDGVHLRVHGIDRHRGAKQDAGAHARLLARLGADGADVGLDALDALARLLHLGGNRLVVAHHDLVTLLHLRQVPDLVADLHGRSAAVLPAQRDEPRRLVDGLHRGRLLDQVVPHDRLRRRSRTGGDDQRGRTGRNAVSGVHDHVSIQAWPRRRSSEMPAPSASRMSPIVPASGSHVAVFGISGAAATWAAGSGSGSGVAGTGVNSTISTSEASAIPGSVTCTYAVSSWPMATSWIGVFLPAIMMRSLLLTLMPIGSDSEPSGRLICTVMRRGVARTRFALTTA